MFLKYFILIGTVLFFATISGAQKKRNIYLGPGMDTLFDRCTYEKEYNDKNYLLLELLDHHTFRHDPVIITNNPEINRDGLILAAKRTENLGIKAEAVFGKDDMTCFVTYDAAIEKITIGRSALVSIVNLFSKEEDKSPQEDPGSHLRKIKVTGKISLNETVVDFIYEINLKKDYLLAGLSGKLWYRGDSLSLQPLKTYNNKKGKSRKGFIGFSLTKGNTIFAAADTFNDFTIYISRSLSEEDRLLISAYFLVIISYWGTPPFIDMTPME